MNICIFGNDGVGKTFVRNFLQRFTDSLPGISLIEITAIKKHPDEARLKLSQLQKPFIAVFVITTEGGRLQSDDVQLLQLFQSRLDCFVLVNKAESSLLSETSPSSLAFQRRIEAIFQHPVKINFLGFEPNDDHLLNCYNDIVKLTPRPYQTFMWPYEELAKLKQEAVTMQKEQEIQLQEAEIKKQQLEEEKHKLNQQIALAAAQLAEHEKKKQLALAQAQAQQAERMRQSQLQEQQRRQHEFAQQRKQEEERQRIRDEQFRAQISRAGR